METQHCICSKEGFGSNLHFKSQKKYCDLIVQYLTLLKHTWTLLYNKFGLLRCVLF